MSDTGSDEHGAFAVPDPVDRPVGGGGKRLFDILFASLALAVGLAVIILLAIALKVLSPGPVFLRHERVGFQGRRFECLKFRTMVIDSEARLQAHHATSPDAVREYEILHKLQDDPRVIPGIGNFLRKSSLDELPQFLNVLLGDMSIVGPRPVTEPEIRKYGPASRSYFRAKPGITGLWQVSGRNDLSFSHRVLLDSVYVRRWSFLWDIAIVFRTVKVLATRRGAC